MAAPAGKSPAPTRCRSLGCAGQSRAPLAALLGCARRGAIVRGSALEGRRRGGPRDEGPGRHPARDARLGGRGGRRRCWLEAPTPERAWYRDVAGSTRRRASSARRGHGAPTAPLPEPGDAGPPPHPRALLRARTAGRDALVGLLQDTSRSIAVRLEPDRAAHGREVTRRGPRGAARDRSAAAARRRALPGIGAGLGLLRDPTRVLRARARARSATPSSSTPSAGDSSVCSRPRACAALYALPEAQASFGARDLQPRVPAQGAARARRRAAATARTTSSANQEVEGYLAAARARRCALARRARRAGRFEAFAFARRLGHRLGLGCWAGEEAAARGAPRPADPALRPARHRRRVRPPGEPLRDGRATRQARERRAMHGHRGGARRDPRGGARRGPARPATSSTRSSPRWADAAAGRARDRHRARRDRDPPRRAVEPLRRARLDAREPAPPSRAPRARARRRRRLPRALRLRVDPPGAALAHAAPGAAPARARRRPREVPRSRPAC